MTSALLSSLISSEAAFFYGLIALNLLTPLKN